MRQLYVTFAFALVLTGCSSSGSPAGSDDATVSADDVPVTDDAIVPPRDVPASDDSTVSADDLPAFDDAVTADLPTDRRPDGDVPCVPSDHKACCGNAVCWFDSCGQAGDTVVECPSGCEDARCRNCTGSCAGKECGGDGCGGDCGLCNAGKCAGLVWTQAQACVSGACTGGGGALSCDDGEVCTDDSCDPKSGCAHVPNTASCDDGDPCTTGDLCSAGACGAGQVPLDCDDQNPCTRDSCVKGVGCKYPNEDDGTLCGNGSCNGLMWAVARHCSGGLCGETGFMDCDDGMPCTVDACTPAFGCTNTLPLNKCLIDGACVVADAADDGNDCRLCKPALDASQWTVLENGDPCGVGDSCYNGECGACVPDCDGRDCGDDGCGGSCGTCPAGSCNELLWTAPGSCTLGTCVLPGSALDCADQDACTADACDATAGCSHAPLQEGAVCASPLCIGLNWKHPKTCVSGQCVGGTVDDCSVVDNCFVGACDPIVGCSSGQVPDTCIIEGSCWGAGDHDPANYCRSCQPGLDAADWSDFSGYCDDRNLCTPVDECVAGECVGGAATCCQDFPDSWGPIGSVSSLSTPADTAVVQAACFDYTGDALGDNGMKGLAGQLNGPLINGIIGGEFAALFEFPAGLDFANSVVFPLYGLTGKSASVPGSPSGPQYVDPVSYSGDCLPVNRFVDARIIGGHLTATAPGLWLHSILPGSNDYNIHLTHVRLKASVATGNASGVVMSGGVVSGVILKTELEAILAAMQVECDAAPAGSRPEFCSYLTVFTSAMSLLFDLHVEPDGTFVAKSKEKPGDAGSFCLQFTTVQATIAGMQP